MTPTELRHLLHMNPELSGKEHETQKLLLKALSDVGYSPKSLCGTGVLALWSPKEGPYHLFRADVDALPLLEETGWKYASKNENMHACGHDVHTAIIFGLAERVRKEKTSKNIAFLFQPAEETGGGARRCIEDLERLDIDLLDAIALHVTDEYPLGTVASRAGTLFASAYEVDVNFLGRPAHVADHKSGVDAIEAAADFLKLVYTRNWEGVLRFGKIRGGNARNIVAARCLLEGTLRSESWKKNEETIKEIEALALECARFHDAECHVTTGSTYPEVLVDEKLLGSLQHVCETLGLTFIECEMKYTGEDFGFFCHRWPSLMFWLGSRVGDQQHGLHHPRFLPPDETIEQGIEILWNLIKFLK